MEFLGRAPFAIIGAFGILGFVDQLLTFHEQIQRWIDLWATVTHPIWDFALGWAFNWLDWPFPDIAKDYLTMGLITTGALVRVAFSDMSLWTGLRDPEEPISYPFCFLLWPIVVIWTLFESFTWERDETHLIFFETFIYAFIVITLNYVLIFAA